MKLLTDRQTDKCWEKYNLLGRGNYDDDENDDIMMAVGETFKIQFKVKCYYCETDNRVSMCNYFCRGSQWMIVSECSAL